MAAGRCRAIGDSRQHERVAAAGVRFGIEPHVRFRGEAGEQATMFFSDPSGNALEFKAFGDDAMLFATTKDPQ